MKPFGHKSPDGVVLFQDADVRLLCVHALQSFQELHSMVCP